MSAAALAVLVVPGTAGAATVAPDVPQTFWARTQIVWAISQGWVPARADRTFTPAFPATRNAAARVLARTNQQLNGVPAQADPYAQAVGAGWMEPGAGRGAAVTQLELDRGIARVLGILDSAITLNGIRTADGWKPALPEGFGVEQIVRTAGARYNVPYPSDHWETWPQTPLRRAHLAVQAYELSHLPSWWRWSVDREEAVARALPAYPPLKKAVLGFAIRQIGAPYVWGGTSSGPQTLFGHDVPGGFDCSGFVWWVMRRSYSVNGTTWSAVSKIRWRTTYDMAAHIPYAQRLSRAELRPGDVLFWSSAPKGKLTAASSVYHAGIYLGNGWLINSSGSGAGVTMDYMGEGAGWFHDAFAFGWRVMPVGV